MKRTHCHVRLVGFALLALASIAAPASCAVPGAATITYRRVFKGSSPELMEIKISDQGKCTFDLRQLDEEPDAQPFEVGQDVRQKIFQLAADLKNFAITDLDVQKKIANLGQKTFRYERDSEVHEATFNYTLNTSATELTQIFEGLARQQGDLVLLEQRFKYDRLHFFQECVFSVERSAGI